MARQVPARSSPRLGQPRSRSDASFAKLRRLCHDRDGQDNGQCACTADRKPGRDFSTPSIEQLATYLVERGQCDARTIERGRRVATETGQRLDRVLLQLGLVSERGLAEALAAISGLKLMQPEDYPRNEKLLGGQLPDRFLRAAWAMPVALMDDSVLVAVADPLDDFTASAIAAATGRRVLLTVAVPIEIEAAFERLYPTAEGSPASIRNRKARRSRKMPSGSRISPARRR